MRKASSVLLGNILLIALLGTGIGNTQATETLKITLPSMEKSSAAHLVYFYQALELALKKTEATDGPFIINYYPEALPVKRFLAELQNGSIVNVMWTTMNKERSEKLLPIRISLLKELNNYRVLLIRKNDQAIFSRIKNVEELRQLRAGLGSQWPETELFKKNNFAVVTAANYESLFKMLAANRFDYFQRGCYEIWNELEAQKDKNLVIEQHLMLHYDAPFYFFVNKKNTKLANRIERGLRIAQEDGSFDKLFFSIPGFKRGYEEQFNKQRLLFRITAQ
jgi:hypothetical protein